MDIKVGESTLNVDVRGRGELVILLPAVARSSNDFERLMTDLVRAGYMTAAINSRGVNGSTGNSKSISVKDVAGDVAGVIKAIGAGPAHVIGHAYSSHVVRVLAEHWPGMVRSVICLGVGGVVVAKIDPLWAVDLILTRDPSDKERQAAIKSSFFAASSDASPWFDGWDVKVLRDYIVSLSTIPDHELIEGGDAPMLILIGEEDKISPPESGAIIRNKLGDRVRVAIIPKAGHAMLFEQPIQVANTIIEFLNGLKDSDRTNGEKMGMPKDYGATVIMATGGREFVEPEQGEDSVNYTPGWDSAITKYRLGRRTSQYAVRFLPNLKQDMKLLDFGCGPGSLTLDFAELLTSGEVVGMDSNPHNIELANALLQSRQLKNVTFQPGNVYQLPFRDNEFDAAWLCSVVMYLERPVEGLREIYRVLKPGGVIAITDMDWSGDVIYPSFRVINGYFAELKKQLNKKGIATDLARSNRFLLREAGFKSVEGHTVAEYYGTPDATHEYLEYVLEFAKLHADKRATDVRSQMLENSWTAWAKHPDAFFSRTHVQAIGWK